MIRREAMHVSCKWKRSIVVCLQVKIEKSGGYLSSSQLPKRFRMEGNGNIQD
jgi:hypothetical protein